jgi:hypothetical protein
LFGCVLVSPRRGRATVSVPRTARESALRIDRCVAARRGSTCRASSEGGASEDDDEGDDFEGLNEALLAAGPPCVGVVGSRPPVLWGLVCPPPFLFLTLV